MGSIANVIAAANRIIDNIIKYLAYLAAALLVFIAFAITCDVLLRYTFNYPLKWVFEATEYSLLIMTFLAATWVLKIDIYLHTYRHFFALYSIVEEGLQLLFPSNSVSVNIAL
ncbi:MAG: TRAP transporter small permease subunit [Desulfofustis sp.]